MKPRQQSQKIQSCSWLGWPSVSVETELEIIFVLPCDLDPSHLCQCAAINRLTEETARVATEMKDRVLGQYDPTKFDSTTVEDVKSAAADSAKEVEAAVQSATSSAADAVHTARREVSKMADGMSETVAELQNTASDAASETQRTASGLATAAHEQAAGMSKAARSAAEDGADRVKSTVDKVIQVCQHIHQTCTVYLYCACMHVTKYSTQFASSEHNARCLSEYSADRGM